MNRHLSRYRIASLAAALLMCVFLTQCGGLTQKDFEKVNVSGFDAEDQKIDHNDYANSMEYFKADEAEDGYLYVGTCNNMGGLIGFYVQMMRDGGNILDAPICPPEIRRYRPDIGPLEWETVLDYRDVEEEGSFKTIGFRFMTILEAEELDKDAPPANFLYAATQGETCDLWRSKTGNYGEWDLVYTFEEFGGSIRWIEQFEGRIYLAIAYDSFGIAPPPGEIWVSDDGLDFRPIMRNGFGDPNNRGVQALIAYNGWLYAGTKNDIDGFDIWKLRPVTPGSEEYEYVRVVSGGGPSSHNENAGMPIIFQDKLYFGTQLYIAGINPTSGNAFEGCDIIRINEDDSWDTIVGPRSLSGYASGFNHFTNSYLWWMEEHDGWLYASTFDQGTLLAGLLANLEGVMDFFQKPQDKSTITTVSRLLNAFFDMDDFYRFTHAGGDIFKSPDGVKWYPVTMDGMGNPRNYGWRTMKSCPDGYLYVGSTNTTTGTEIWRGKVPQREKATAQLLQQFK
ncbi:MAG TPA: hypothetical protein PLD73_02390 [Candidatus Hydrogenedentes bacterium]|jgi:hypothetical protein|nr:hypothetical protein [Candidatus Hydrogenedentota bacterium]HPJ98405.1 hypothetical protein [Candidatus Hydrogenedentota bacterium]